ncbi:MAG: hypothetical protein EBU90_24320 [Proteobacteria bacterium]|nr:hypothetical protein [Pseudomonadota bacterium]
MTDYGNYDDCVFVSKPLAKILFDDGLGFYILNAYNYHLFPKFYASFYKDHWELGFYFVNYVFEIMWNKHFVK